MASSEKRKNPVKKPEPDQIDDAVVVEAKADVPEESGEKADAAATHEIVERPKSRNGFVPALIGGVVAAAIGFGAAQFLGNDRWPFQSGPSPVDALTEVVAVQNTRIDGLAEKTKSFDQAISDLATRGDFDAIVDQQKGIKTQLGGISEQLQALAQRLSDVENRPNPNVGATADAVKAYERELTAMRKMFEDELARIEAAQTDAIKVGQTSAALASQAMERAAIVRIEAAIDSGAPFDDALSSLTEAGISVPATLSAVAKTGVVSLAELQNSFPASARSALQASDDFETEAGQISRWMAFLRSQLGTRSLEPRDGSDTDAVLSRAEGALKNGNLAESLTMLAELSQSSLAVMDNWIAEAHTRQNAVDAVAALTVTVNK